MFEETFTKAESETCICPGYDICSVFLCGLLLGIIINHSWHSAVILFKTNFKDGKHQQITGSQSSRKTVNLSETSCEVSELERPMLDSGDGSFQVLEAAVSLVTKHIHKKRTGTKVVEYLSPEQMLGTLFSVDSSNSLNLKRCTSNNTLNGAQEMVQCFEQIMKYSVNTNHPLFFNQLFGALDPVAFAAELIALSVNTSAYTYETAPVFTMIERELFSHLSQLIFGANSGHDGLMLPGGSLSNLTALHVARYYAKKCYLQSIIMNDSYKCHVQEEKKQEDANVIPSSSDPELVAFVSSEAHYSFAKSVSVTGIGRKNLIVVPTLSNGQMDAGQLDAMMVQLENEGQGAKVPFFVAVTSGSTVRGSFDDIEAIVQVCRRHEERLNARFEPSFQRSNINSESNLQKQKHKIWIHVDGAWGGSAIFSSRRDIQELMKGVEQVDSFTFNPHKMLGAPQQTTAFITRHEGVLKAANSTGAKYLFDSRKHGAEYDLGDASYTCGRRTDAIKLWAQLKFYGSNGIGSMLESKVDSLQLLAESIRKDDRFVLACDPWPFNVNFYYLPRRIRKNLVAAKINIKSNLPKIPDELAQEFSQISVKLKLLLHKSGEMMIPFQPLNDQKADCFRVVLAGKKCLGQCDIEQMLNLMDKYGHDL